MKLVKILIISLLFAQLSYGGVYLGLSGDMKTASKVEPKISQSSFGPEIFCLVNLNENWDFFLNVGYSSFNYSYNASPITELDIYNTNRTYVLKNTEKYDLIGISFGATYLFTLSKAKPRPDSMGKSFGEKFHPYLGIGTTIYNIKQKVTPELVSGEIPNKAVRGPLEPSSAWLPDAFGLKFLAGFKLDISDKLVTSLGFDYGVLIPASTADENKYINSFVNISLSFGYKLF